MFWRLKTQIPSIPSKQPWNGLLSSYIKVSQISHPILWFFSCRRVTPCPSKNPTRTHSERYQATGSLIKLFWGRRKQTLVYVQENFPGPTLPAKLPRPRPKKFPPWAGLPLVDAFPSLRIEEPAPCDLPQLFSHKHNKNRFFFSGCDVKICSMRWNWGWVLRFGHQTENMEDAIAPNKCSHQTSELWNTNWFIHLT